MGFEIGNKVKSGEITLKDLEKQYEGKVEKSKLSNIFNQFNTNQTANASGEQVLDQTEQMAMMSFFKEIAGGKKGDSTDTEISRKDLKHFKKAHKGSADAAVVQNVGYKDLKKIAGAFSGAADGDNSVEVNGYEQGSDGEVTSVTVDGKKYTVDKDNHLVDGNGVKYEYKDGKLTKIQNGNETTDFNNGVRHQTTKTENGKSTTTTYQADGNTRKQQVVADSNAHKTTTTNYRADGKTVSDTVVDDQQAKTKTTTTFLPDGKTKLREVVVDSSNTEDPKTTTTNYNTQGGLVKRTISSKSENVNIDYSTKQRTTTRGDVVTVQDFNSFDNTTGNIENSAITKTVTTDKKNHTRTTERSAEAGVKTVEFLDDNNNNVNRTVKTDSKNHTATFTSGGKTVTLKTDKNGNVIANRRFTGTRYETVGETVIRLGYKKDSPEYNAIVKANGGAGKHGVKVKIPANLNNLKGLNLDTANVDASAELKKYRAYQEKVQAERIAAANAKVAAAELQTINQRIANAPNRAKELAKQIRSYGGVRQTYATANHKVYCDNFYSVKVNSKYVNHSADAGTGNWQQHWVYNPISDSMVRLEEVMDNKNKLNGAHVKYITESGYATLTDGRTIKIDFKNFDNQMKQKVTSLTTKYYETEKEKKEAAAALAKDAAESRKNMPKMKDVDGNEIASTPSEKAKAEAAAQAQSQAANEASYSKAQFNTSVSEWNSNYSQQYNTTGIKYSSGNYISLEGGPSSADADAIMHLGGARYTIKRDDGIISDTVMDYYNITGQRTVGQSQEQHIIGSDGYFNPHSSGFRYGADQIYLEAHGTNSNGAEFDGCPISSLQDTNGRWRVVIEKDNTYYDLNKLLDTNQKVVVRPGTFVSSADPTDAAPEADPDQPVATE